MAAKSDAKFSMSAGHIYILVDIHTLDQICYYESWEGWKDFFGVHSGLSCFLPHFVACCIAHETVKGTHTYPL